MIRLLPVIALLALVAQLARASDFSELGKPDFARALLMSPQQREEMACTEGWIAIGIDRSLAPLIAEMDDRHAVSLGSRRFTEKRYRIDEADVMQVELGDPDAAPAPTLEEEKKRRLAALPPRCATLADAFGKGGLAAATPLLAARPAAVIALPPTGQCLKQLERGKVAESDRSIAGWVLDLRRRLARSALFTAAEKAAIERDYAAYMPPTAPADDSIDGEGPRDLRELTCFPVVTELSKRLAGAD